MNKKEIDFATETECFWYFRHRIPLATPQTSGCKTILEVKSVFLNGESLQFLRTYVGDECVLITDVLTQDNRIVGLHQASKSTGLLTIYVTEGNLQFTAQYQPHPYKPNCDFGILNLMKISTLNSDGHFDDKSRPRVLSRSEMYSIVSPHGPLFERIPLEIDIAKSLGRIVTMKHSDNYRPLKAEEILHQPLVGLDFNQLANQLRCFKQRCAQESDSGM